MFCSDSLSLSRPADITGSEIAGSAGVLGKEDESDEPVLSELQFEEPVEPEDPTLEPDSVELPRDF